MITPLLRLDSREQWRPQPVETVERLATINGQPVRLDNLPPGRMNFSASMTDPADTPVVGYTRCVKAANLWWHQFWLWYLYNPWEIAGIGRHEGDWELVQLGCVDKQGNEPVLVTASQHRSGEKREYWRCELDSGGCPVIYVARGSHANYFTAGDRGEDVANGLGRAVSPEWREFGAWASWPGRWGNSMGAGKSPESPGCQEERWNTPHVFHARAR